MTRRSFSRPKAVILTSLCCFGLLAAWLILRDSSPYRFEVVSVTQNAGENMKVAFRFTNESDSVLKFSLIENGLQSVSYISAGDPVPKVHPLRLVGFSGSIRWEEKEVKPGKSIVITDNDSIRKSGDEFYAMWQPPNLTDWLSQLRRKIRGQLVGYPIRLSGLPPAPMTWKERIAEWIEPDPPKPLVSKKFVVP
ncbi:MAG: hypothetical protein HKN23_01315 [Verrucomicrobiales bacterium]|nr:hypothetical protein [Verrucomicrobiales bacterium]